MNKAAGPSQRMLRAGELIRHALAQVIQRGDIGELLHDDLYDLYFINLSYRVRIRL